MPEDHPNQLIDETSPYLRQHAYNPVRWHPWNREALDRARREDLPILLSVGYSACHWCHVMERESFESTQIAAIMNEHFVNIKVDREERPDLDEIYMSAVQAMIGSGGWPMTVFLTPELKPFYGGTYYPPEDRYGRPGFPTVLRAVSDHYRTQRDKVEEQAGRLVDLLQQNAQVLTRGEESSPDDAAPDYEAWWAAAFAQLKQSYDAKYGGFGGAPKFPGSMNLALLLRYHQKTGDGEALQMVEHTLQQMANGGMYDHLGGGFHRYSVDERWLAPHFEKMLYDNALLTWVYLEAFQQTGGQFYRSVSEETLDYVLREMSSPEGGYCSTQDADSEGEEGKFFVWHPAEVEEVLGEAASRLFCRYYDITPEGNFEGGSSILHVDTNLPQLARFLRVDDAELKEVVQAGKAKLFEVRARRVAPGRDDKIIVAWNGLMISAMAQGYRILGNQEYLESSRAAATFILEEMVVDGELLHSYKDGVARLKAYQDDYACFANGLLDLYEASFEVRWLSEARTLTDAMIERFWDDEQGGFFYTEADAEDLIVRTKNPYDNATPSGNSVGTLALLRLAVLTGIESYRERAAMTLGMSKELIARSPTSCAQMLCALYFFEQTPLEVAVVGSAEEGEPFLRALNDRFQPGKVVTGWNQAEEGGADIVRLVPLLEGKIDGREGVTAYVCRNSVCSSPVNTVDGLVDLLEESDDQPGGRIRTEEGEMIRVR